MKDTKRTSIFHFGHVLRPKSYILGFGSRSHCFDTTGRLCRRQLPFTEVGASLFLSKGSWSVGWLGGLVGWFCLKRPIAGTDLEEIVTKGLAHEEALPEVF